MSVTGAAIDRAFLLETLRELVRIESVNPSLSSTGSGEPEVVSAMAGRLQHPRIEIEVLEATPGRPSLVAVLPGSGGGRSLMLNAHVDTVDVDQMAHPFSAEIREGRLYGRGAYDMKGGAAACMTALTAIADREQPLRGDLMVTLVADEEYESIGIQEVLNSYRTDGAIVTEPTHLGICLAHKGFMWINVDIGGRAAHGSRYDLGIDANMRMGRFISRLADLEKEMRGSPGHPLVGPPSLHAATLKGGSGLSTYAEHCRLQIERRLSPGESPSQVMEQLNRIASELEVEEDGFKSSMTVFCVRDPFEVAPDAPIVASLAASYTLVTGEEPRFTGDHAWMDAAFLSKAGIDTVVFGPSGGGAHAREEWVEIASAEQVARVLTECASSYCA